MLEALDASCGSGLTRIAMKKSGRYSTFCRNATVFQFVGAVVVFCIVFVCFIRTMQLLSLITSVIFGNFPSAANIFVPVYTFNQRQFPLPVVGAVKCVGIDTAILPIGLN